MTKILIVDDSEANHRFATYAIKNIPLPAQEIFSAKNKEEAMRLLQTQNFDVVLMDMELTDRGHEGEELIKLARKEGPNQAIAIVGWSSNPGYGDEMLAAGADAFACKRYMGSGSPLDTLRTAIGEALQKTNGRDSERYTSVTEAMIQPPPEQRAL